MTVYKKKIETTNPRFRDRAITISYPGGIESIPIPDTDVLCNSCNRNIYPETGWQIYLSKNDVKADHVYDIYCETCCKRVFPKAEEVPECFVPKPRL